MGQMTSVQALRPPVDSNPNPGPGCPNPYPNPNPNAHGADDVRAGAAPARGLVVQRARGVRLSRPLEHGAVRAAAAGLVAQAPQDDARVVLVPLHHPRLRGATAPVQCEQWRLVGSLWPPKGDSWVSGGVAF